MSRACAVASFSPRDVLFALVHLGVPLPQGMRISRSAEEFGETLAACRREAMSSFSDDVVLIEK